MVLDFIVFVCRLKFSLLSIFIPRYLAAGLGFIARLHIPINTRGSFKNAMVENYKFRIGGVWFGFRCHLLNQKFFEFFEFLNF